MTSGMQSFTALGMCFPFLSHILVRWLTKEGFAMTGEDSLMLGISFRDKKWIWFLAATFLPWIYTETGNLLSLVFCRQLYDPQYYLTLEIDQKLLFLMPANAIVSGTIGSFAALGEEGGWRGYMMPKLCKLVGHKKALFFGGTIWGLWHAPLTCIGHNFGTDYPGFPYVGILKMCILCILLGILLTILTQESGSIWPAAILHAVNNAGPSVLNGYINPDQAGTYGRIAGWSGYMIAILIVVLAVLMILQKKKKTDGRNGITA